MMEFALQDAKHPYIISLTRDITHNIQEGDKFAEVEALFNWFKNNIRYINDVYKVETLIEPVDVLTIFKSGDCDDLTMTFASMLLSIGLPVQFVIIKTNPNEGWKHVYLRTKVKGQWIPIDLSKRDGYIGWEYPNPIDKRIYNVSHGNLVLTDIDNDLSGFLPSWEDIQKWAGIVKQYSSSIEQLAAGKPDLKKSYEKWKKYQEFKNWLKNPMTIMLFGGLVITTIVLIKRRKK